MVFLYVEFGKVFKNKIFVNINNYGCVLVGSVGFLFDDVYVDWNGVWMCVVLWLDNNMYLFWLYLLGEDMVKYFVDNNILLLYFFNVKICKINNLMFMLKNFYKGLLLFKLKYMVVNSIKIVIWKFNDIFNEIDKELNGNCLFIKFI